MLVMHRVAVGVGVVATLALAVLMLARGEPERSVELPGAVAFTAVMAAPAVLAVLSLYGRTILLVPAAVVSIAMSPMLWSGLPLLLVPGVLYALAFTRRRWPVPPTALPRFFAATLPGVFIVVALVLLIGDTQQRCASSGHSYVCSQVPPTSAVVATVGLIAVTIAGAWVASAPRVPPQRS